MDWNQYLAAIRHDGALLAAAAARSLAPDVPSCPGWTVGDLVEHVAVVHRHKIAILRDRLQENPDPPTAPESGLLEWYRSGLDELGTVLAATPPGTEVHTWLPGNRTAGFWYRRMAHETLIHRVDAELAFGAPSAVDPALAADGIDEVLVDYVGGYPDWGEFVPEERCLRVQCTDRPEAWTVQFGRFSGTSPHSGTDYDLDAFVAVEGCEPAAVISAPAAAIDLWLWGRGTAAALEVAGDRDLAGRLRAICEADMG